jgi:ATP-dependent exoDNAse (exonuclease V) alpha subunit
MKRLQITPPPGLTFTEDQLFGARALEHVCTVGGILVLEGWAGTGKSVELIATAQALEDAGIQYVVACPTGRAASRLRQGGVKQASTMHSWLYYPRMDNRGNLIGFQRRTMEDLPSRFVLLFDEASMLGPNGLYDLLEVVRPDPGSGRACVFVGDPFQLPPILSKKEVEEFGEEFSLFSAETLELLQADHVQLHEVVRQAAGSPIVSLATALRSGSPPPRPDGQTISVVRKGRAEIERRVQMAASPETVVLTWTNKDRRAINDVAREARGFHDELCLRDRLVVTANHAESGLCNGDLIDVVSIDNPIEHMAAGRIYPISYDGPWGRQEGGAILYYDGIDAAGRTVFAKAAAAEKDYDLGRPLVVDYGYALTVHKAQGCEFQNVEVYTPDAIERMMGEEGARKWLYTALTRAKQSFFFSGQAAIPYLLGG